MKNTERNTTLDVAPVARTRNTSRKNVKQSTSGDEIGALKRGRPNGASSREGWYRDRDGIWLKPCRVKEKK
ncbi:Uncharacterised protein [Mycobacteroides abscessus subsp. abscessus]|nr:Uncharacterised protein [Mycobacteroides abscessus subsp. abscessus]